MTAQLTGILERLVAARKAAGLSQSQAAKLIGLQTAQGLCDIEKGRSPLTIERFLKMCETYDVGEVWALVGVNPDFDPQSAIEAAQAMHLASDELNRVLKTLELKRG